MNIETKQIDGILFVKPLDKSIESINSREFKAQVIDLIKQGNSRVLINLSKVEFIDSSGLGSLISVLKLLATSDGNMVICEAQDQAMKIFTLTRLNNAFRLFSTEKEAIQALETLTPDKNRG